MSRVWGVDRSSRLPPFPAIPSVLDWPAVEGSGDAGGVVERAFRMRRATDRYMTAGLVGLALFAWIVVVRVALTGDVGAALIYAVPAVVVTYGAVGLARQMFKHWERRPPGVSGS